MTMILFQQKKKSVQLLECVTQITVIIFFASPQTCLFALRGLTFLKFLFVCVFLLFSISDSRWIQKGFLRVHFGVRFLFWIVVAQGGCARHWCSSGSSQPSQLAPGGPSVWGEGGGAPYQGVGHAELVAWINMNSSNRFCRALGGWPRRFYREVCMLQDLFSWSGLHRTFIEHYWLIVFFFFFLHKLKQC